MCHGLQEATKLITKHILWDLSRFDGNYGNQTNPTSVTTPSSVVFSKSLNTTVLIGFLWFCEDQR